ncbi:MAG: hypothetical protein JWO59_2444 [Chloroflexi bacterium]|nr:hypothetical protein [Chloroflexota bacterium]
MISCTAANDLNLTFAALIAGAKLGGTLGKVLAALNVTVLLVLPDRVQMYRPRPTFTDII